MTTKILLTTLATIGLCSCGSQTPTRAEQLQANADVSQDIASRYKKGLELEEGGKKQVKKGKELIKDGEKMIKKGREMREDADQEAREIEAAAAASATRSSS
jgi:hypothetical protein